MFGKFPFGRGWFGRGNPEDEEEQEEQPSQTGGGGAMGWFFRRTPQRFPVIVFPRGKGAFALGGQARAFGSAGVSPAGSDASARSAAIRAMGGARVGQASSPTIQTRTSPAHGHGHAFAWAYGVQTRLHSAPCTVHAIENPSDEELTALLLLIE